MSVGPTLSAVFCSLFCKRPQHLTTLIEGFPCFFFRCKANARVKPANGGRARTLPNFCVVLYIVLCCSMYCFVLFYVLFCVVLCIVLCCSMNCFVLFYVLFCVVLCIVLCCSMYCFVLFYALFYVLIVLWRSLYCLCVYVYWTTATGWLSNYSYIYIIYHITSRNTYTSKIMTINTLRTGSFKLFKRPFPGFLTILTL